MAPPRLGPTAPIRFGVKSRLWAALLALSIAPTLAGGHAVLALRDAAADLSGVAESDLPQVTAALQLSALGQRMVTVGPALAAANGISEQDALRDDYQTLEKEAETLIAVLADHHATTDALKHALQRFHQNFQQLDALVQRRLTAQKEQSLTQRTVADLAQMLALSVESGAATAQDQETLRRLARLGGSGAKMQAAFLALANVKSVAALPTLGRTLKEESVALSQAAEGLPPALQRDVKPTVSFWAQLVADDPLRPQQALIELDEQKPKLLNANAAAARALDQEIERLRNDIQTAAAATAAAGQARVGVSQTALITVTVGGVLFALALGWFYVDRRVARRLVQLEQAMRAAAQGDMSRPLPDGRDEIAGMAQALAVFKSHAEQLARQRAAMAEHAEQVAEASRQALTAAAQVAETAQTQRDALDRVAGAVAESAKGVGEVSDASETADARARASVDAAQAGLRAIRGLDALALRIGDNAEQVGRIAAAIADIAAKTNMLSLNASIEAARAGEGGKGFSVVAQRVRKLAEEAAEAADQIAIMVKRAADDAVAERAAARDCIALMERIAEVSGETGGMIRAIAVAMNQQEAAMAAADDSVKGLRQHAFTNAAAAEEIAQSVARLSRLAETARLGAQA